MRAPPDQVPLRPLPSTTMDHRTSGFSIRFNVLVFIVYLAEINFRAGNCLEERRRIEKSRTVQLRGGPCDYLEIAPRRIYTVLPPHRHAEVLDAKASNLEARTAARWLRPSRRAVARTSGSRGKELRSSPIGGPSLDK
jgi:hypothetical protein